MSSRDPASIYRDRRAEWTSQVERLARSSHRLSWVRIAVFILTVALVVVVRHRMAVAWGVGFGGLVLFLVLVTVHDRILGRLRRAELARDWNARGLSRLAFESRGENDGTPDLAELAVLPDGHPAPEESHPYASDLDVVGKRSLLARIDTTRTREARSKLARWLTSIEDAPDAALTEIRRRQHCARALSSMVELRERLAVEGGMLARGGGEDRSLEPLLTWCEAKPSAVLIDGRLGVAAWLLPALIVGLPVVMAISPLARVAWFFALFAELMLLWALRSEVAPAIDVAAEHHRSLDRWVRMIEVVETARFDVKPLFELQERLRPSASAAVARLGRIVSFIDARNNEAFRLLIAPLLLWDVHCARALERFRRRDGARLRRVLDAVAEVEALSALGTRAFDFPEDVWPEVVGEGSSLISTGLAHPLIPLASAVRNDVSLHGAGATLLVTGSNMSGKSTLLRAIGCNVVLALAGTTVRARSLRLAPFAVHTTMRVHDALGEGVSLFLAELRRLRMVVSAAEIAARTASSGKARPVMFLLDEILHGTNSRERHIAARSVLRHLVRAGAVGAVSTHDLGLATLERVLPGRVQLVHFRESISEVDGVECMTFDYRLRPGVVQTSNALRLMRMVGLQVELDDDGQPPSSATAPRRVSMEDE